MHPAASAPLPLSAAVIPGRRAPPEPARWPSEPVDDRPRAAEHRPPEGLEHAQVAVEGALDRPDDGVVDAVALQQPARRRLVARRVERLDVVAARTDVVAPLQLVPLPAEDGRPSRVGGDAGVAERAVVVADSLEDDRV